MDPKIVSSASTVERLDAARQKAKEKEEYLKKKHQEEYRKVRTAVQALAGDKNFQIALRHLAKICGFWKSSIVVDRETGRVFLESTSVNEGRRSVYLDFRRLFTDEMRRDIESRGDEHEAQLDQQTEERKV